MKDREINLIDLIVKILLGWRVVLVFMLIGGILVGGLGYVHSYQTQKAQIAAQIAVQENLQQDEEGYFRDKLTEIQFYNVCTVLENERSADEQELYFQESVKMHINAYNVPRAELIYRVEAEDLETAYQIEQIYEDIIPDGLTKWLAEDEQEEISVAAMSELIELGVDVMKERDSFSIVIYHLSEDQCMDLAERAEEYVRNQSAQLARELGEHNIQLVSRNFSFVMDSLLWDKQRSLRNSILGLRSGAAKTKDGFTNEEWQYYNYMARDDVSNGSVPHQEEGEELEQIDDLQALNIAMIVYPSVEPIYVLLGMFIFAFLYIICVALQYAFNEKVQMTDDVNAIYGVNELGTIPVANKKKKILGFVDDVILKLSKRSKRQFSFEKAIGLAAAAVNIAAQKEGLQEVCCVGCDLQKDALAIADMIGNILKKGNISMQVINDILYNQESMEQVLSVKGAFLLEKAGGTLYDEIDRELDLLQRQDIKVLGMIVME